MLRRDPAHRYRVVKSAISAPTHAVEAALYEHRRSPGARIPASYAEEIYLDAYEREVMQAWIASGADDAYIEQVLEVPAAVTQAYRHLFFDMGVFRDRLDLLSWVRAYQQAPEASKEGAALLQMAVMRGPTVLAWIYGKGAVDVDTTEVLKHAMADAFFRGQSSREYALSSKEASAAQALMSNAVKIASVLDKKKPSDVNALALKLKYREMTTTANHAQQDGEELLH